MDYRSVIFYVALFLIAGSLLEIYVRKKERVKVEKSSKGRVLSSTRSISIPLLLLGGSIVAAIAARYWH